MRRSRPGIVFLVLFFSTAAFAIEPPSFSDAHPVAQPAPRLYGVGSPRIASDGSGFLAVFSDSRYGDQDVLGNRYDENGALIDEVAFPIRATWRSDAVPVVVWNGADYAVLANTEYIGTARLHVTHDGKVVSGGDDFPASDGLAVDMAWNGGFYAVPFLKSETLNLQLLDAAMDKTSAVPIGDPAEPVRAAAIATDGRNFLLVWETATRQAYTLRAQIFDDHGHAQSEVQTLTSEPNTTIDAGQTFFPSSLGPTISWNGLRYLVGWTSPALGVAAAFVEADGTASAPIAFGEPASPRSAAAAWDGTAFLLTWSSSSPDLPFSRAVLLSSTAVPLNPPFSFGVRSTRAGLAANLSFFFVLTEAGERLAIYSSGPVGTRVFGNATSAYLPQTSPSMASGNTTALLAWYEGRSVAASIIGPDGATRITTFVGYGSNYGADVISTAFAEGVYLVAWTDPATMTSSAARVTESGGLLDRGNYIQLEPRRVVTGGGQSLMLATTRQLAGQTGYEELVVEPVPLSGRWGAAGLHAIATNLYAGTEVHSLVPTPDGFALFWKKFLDPPCFSSHCSRRAEELVMFLSPTGSVTKEAVLWWETGTAAIFLAEAAGNDGILVAGWDLGHHVSLRTVRFDGTVTDGVVIATSSAPLHASMVSTPDGFQLFFDRLTAPGPVTTSGYDIRMLPLTKSGQPAGAERTVRDDAFLGNATRAFGQTWLAWTFRWQPLPAAHQGFVTRAFYQVIPERRRSASARR